MGNLLSIEQFSNNKALKNSKAPVTFHDVSDSGQHAIEAFHPSFEAGSVPIASMSWRKEPGEPPMSKKVGEIDTIDVDPGYQRAGIGTHMWNLSQQFDTPALHSSFQTKPGKKWAAKVGGPSVG